MFRLIQSGALLAVAVTLLFSCGQTSGHNADPLSANLDTSIRPQDDFFEYANGGWLQKHPIPAAYKSWGIGNEVQQDLFNRLKTINERAVKNSDSQISQKIAAFYSSGMDSISLSRQSVAVLTPEFSLIDSIQVPADVIDVAAKLSIIGVHSLFDYGIRQDDKNSSKVIFSVSQGGLGLPNRDYYIKNDARTTKIRRQYQEHIQQILTLTGVDKQRAAPWSQQILELETTLAKASKPLADLRDPYKNYHKFAVQDYDEPLKTLHLKSWLSGSGMEKVDTVVVGQPAFFTALDAALTTTTIAVWKHYLKWQLLRSLGKYVNNDLELADFHFYGEVMQGLKAQKPRWKRVLAAEQTAMGEALGQLFVKAYFPPAAKKRYEELVEQIRAAFKERIEKLTWMEAATKSRALDKLAKMHKKVGYPDKWKDFSQMKITRQPYVKNIINAKKWWHQYQINKLGKPVDRLEWVMTPQTYNAYYNPSNNEIVLPAGIFTVPGKKDAELDDALVYGYAGASTIGHEITHGFDDEGRQYDAAGNLSNWWTKGDEAAFKKRAAVMIRQFNRYNPIDSLHINGSATLGENMADLGGILIGWDAFQKTATYKSGKKIGGLAPAQRFFLGYALGWLYQIRPESLARQLLVDVHSPAKYRVNGPFCDVDAFYQTFQVKPGDQMYLPDSNRVRIW